MDNSMLSVLLYADDIVLLAPGEISLQRMMDTVTKWCENWKLTINSDKTKVVHFRPYTMTISRGTFSCVGQSIQFTDSYKYLGVWLDEHITFLKNAKELAKSASRALGAVYGKVISAGGVTHSVFSKLYSTMVEPILLYGSGIWGYKNFSQISTVQNKACKLFLGVGNTLRI